MLHRPTRKLACLRLTALVAGFALARILSTSLLAPSSLAARVVHAWSPLLDAMRRDGVRMQNTFKNVGKAGYAFNALQRLLLPASLRAPKDTTVSGLEA